MELDVALENYKKSVENFGTKVKRLYSDYHKFIKFIENGNIKSINEIFEKLKTASIELKQNGEEIELFDFDGIKYLSEKKGFFTEMEKAAKDEGLKLYLHQEYPNCIFCYPIIIKIESEMKAIRIDKKLENNISPKLLAKKLKKIQIKDPKINITQFLESVYNAYKYIKDRKGKVVDVVSLKDIYKILTIHPDLKKNYAFLDFMREIYFLDKSGINNTKDEHLIHFITPRDKASSNTIFIDKEGKEKIYHSIKFSK